MEATIRITGAGSEMQGVGRMDDGRCVFVPGALPGETAHIEITRDMDRYLLSRLLYVAQKSPDRAQPPCPWYAECGGCAAQHMTYPLSLSLKTQRVSDALLRIGGIAEPRVLPTLGMPDDPWRARRKAEYIVRGAAIGCAKAKSRDVVEIDDCLLQHKESIHVLHAARTWLRAHPGEGVRFIVTRVNDAGETAVTISTEGRGKVDSLADTLVNESNGVRSVYRCRLTTRPAHALDGVCERMTGARTIEDHLLGLSFALSPQSFFQVNPPQAEKLFSVALDMAALSPRDTAVDAYCGAGAISLLLARAAKRVYGIEIVAPAIEDARKNALHNGLADKCTFIAGDVKDALPALVRGGTRPAVMTVDPPRKGLDASVIETAKACLPEKIVYVSCNPATMARDARLLCENGPYRFEYAQPVDMFPWTEHVETVMLMSRGVTNEI